MSTGALYLVPTVIAEGGTDVIPAQVIKILPSIRHFLVEDARTARRYLSSLSIYESIEALQISVLNKDTRREDIPSMMQPLFEGHHVGVISESGCPGVADPGALAVGYAQSKGVKVIPLVGPSSILLALMASGLNGQHFTFNGYCPIDQGQATALIKSLEKDSKKKNQTQIFIETPYRNNQLFAVMLKVLHPDTLLTIALDVSGPGEEIRTQTVKQWQSHAQKWPKLPAVFLFLA